MTASINTATATAAELLAFYNAHSGAPAVKRFSDRAAGARRVDALLQAQKPAKAPTAPSAPKVARPPADRSAAIAKSWQDPATAAARATRSHVVVGGVEYTSTHQAFLALGLPANKCIAFRGKLKAAGKLAFDGHMFKVVE
jgi:hypothetical protein